MISCKTATELISKSLEEQLSLKDRCSLLLHLYICEFCEQFRKQLLLIRETLRGNFHNENEPTDTSKSGLSPESKKKISEAIDRESRTDKS